MVNFIICFRINFYKKKQFLEIVVNDFFITISSFNVFRIHFNKRVDHNIKH